MNSSSKSVLLAAPAKINLVLEILAKEKSGYHSLSTVFQALELADELLISLAPDNKLTIIDRVNTGLPIESDDNNLVIKAQRTLEAYCKRPLPCHVRLVKSIPAGGGLGGGSADAAAMLIGLNDLYELGLCKEELQPVAAKLGADVAFGLMGGTALGLGHGDLLSKLPTTLATYKVILIIPEHGLSTPSVYAHWDTMDEKKRSVAYGNAHRFVEIARQPGALDNALLVTISNDLQTAAFEMYPELANIRRSMMQAGCVTAMLCGSGSTMFGLVEPQVSPSQLEAMVKELSACGRVIVTSLRSGNN